MIGPKVSIIMSTYNNGDYIQKAIESVLSQSYTNFEFIIINDNSKDNTEDIIKQYHDTRIVYIKNEKNNGLITNLNKGIAQARGEYIARIDSDDYWLSSEKLAEQVNFLDTHSDYALVGTWAHVYDNDGNPLYDIIYPKDDSTLKKNMLLRNQFVHSSVVFRKQIAGDLGMYDISKKYVEDYALWLHMGTQYKCANLPEFYVGYLHNVAGETQQHNVDQIKANLILIQEFKHVYPRYVTAKVRWFTKYCLVFFGALSLINRLKKMY